MSLKRQVFPHFNIFYILHTVNFTLQVGFISETISIQNTKT